MLFMELMATLGLDSSKYNEGMDGAEKRAGSAGSAIAKGLGAAGAAVGAAVGAAATGVVKLTSAAVSSYGEYEQLAGGVQKIFQDSSDAVMKFASDAYKTAGLSANDYMQTVTGFSASLLQGLDGDTQAAAEIANKAIIDMSDNANTYGTDMQSIQNAYMGFAKNNYTMLDNLKLGYGGTASEMVRLIQDSGVLGEAADELTAKNLNEKVSFDQIIEAIHVVQEEQNIAGTTSKEAAGTIQGSIGSLKGAWDNLVTGLADPNADLGELIGNMVDVASKTISNLVPIITQALTGIASLIEQVVPIIADMLPTLINTLLPPLLTAATTLITAVLGQLPTILSILMDQVPVVLGQLLPVVMDVLPQLIATVTQIIVQIVQFIAANADQIVPAIVEIIHTIVSTLTDPGVLIPLIQATLQIINAIVTGLMNATPELVGMIMEIIANVIVTLESVFPDIVDTVLNLLGSLATAVILAIGSMMGLSLDEIFDAWTSLEEWFENLGPNIMNWFGELWTNISGWFEETATNIATFVAGVVDGIGEAGSNIIGGVVTFFSNIGSDFTKGFNDMLDTVTGWGTDVWDGITGTFNDIIDFVKGCVDDLIAMFDFDWSLPEIKLPHFQVSGGEAPWGFAGQGTFPSVSIQWYKKAMDTPYLLDSATIFGAAGGNLMGAGEAGPEMIYSHERLMDDIGAIIDNRLDKLQFVIPVYIGQKKIEQQIVTATAHSNVISGGR